MKSNLFYSCFFIFLGIFVFGISPVFAINDSNFSTEDLDKYIYLNNADAKSILRSIPQALTDAWIESVISVASAEEEAIEVIVRKSVSDNIRDYLLIEGPKEVGIEIIKLGFKIGKMVLTKNIGDLIGEFEKLTVKESVNYLSQWLKEKEIKIATGNLDFSYDNFQNKKEKAQFQYIIFYYPITDSEGEVVINIFSAKSIEAPGSFGSLTNSWGVGWNYSDEYAKGKKLAPFILIMSGEMERKKSGYWQSDIIHSYSWKSQPNIEIEFPNNVPYFDFHKKGFIEKVGDKIKGFFGKIGDLFSGASVIDAPEIEINLNGTIDLSADSALGRFINYILEQFRAFQSFLGQAELNALENQAQDIITEDDLLAFMEKIELLQAQLEAMGKKINLLQAGGGISLSTTELDSEQNQQTGENIIINEICSGLDSAKNEFIELYNPNSVPISLDNDNFFLQLVDSNNNITKKKITWINDEIPAKGYFLLIGGELLINGKKVQGDATFSSQLSSVSGVIVTDENGEILDKAGWGKPEQSPPPSAVENQGKILEKGLGTGKSLGRSNYVDTNNNSADFSISESPSPKNSLGQEFVYNIQGGNKSDSGEESATSTEKTSSSSPSQNISGGGSSSVPHLCSQNNLGTPTYSPVIINEVAWMGSQAGFINEWIELKNISNSAVNLNGWQLLDKEEQIKIIFNANHIIPAGGFYLLERNDNEAVPNITADIIYTGTLANNDESLRLYGGNCILVDEVVANTDWPAGDNNTKKTMERGGDLSWHNYNGQGTNGIIGTPKAENSVVSSEQQGENNENQEEDEEEEEVNEDENFVSGLVITEVMAAGSEEFVEIYNPLEQEIFLIDYYFSYFSASRDWNNPFLNKKFSTSTPSIPAKTYIVIGLGDYSEQESDWKPYQTHLSDDNGSVALFSCDPSQATTTQLAMDCKIDTIGWGQPLVYETESATSSVDKSLARRLSPDENGFLKYVDTDNNNQDFEEQDPTPGQQNYSPYSDLDDDGIINESDSLTKISQDTTLPAGEYTFKDLEILQGFKLILESDTALDGFKGAKITADNISVNTGASIITDGKGYPSLESGPGTSAISQVGASYGGFGGRNESDPKLFIYGDLENPIELGSGASGNPEVPGLTPYRPGGAGGGAIILNIQGELKIDGVISSSGQSGMSMGGWGFASTGAGSGGSINITTNILSGLGSITANGGNSSSGSGAGGGGRIAVYYNTNNFTGNIQAFGGQDEDNIINGGPGTIFMSQAGIENLVLDNNGRKGVTILSNNSYVFSDVVIKGGTNFYLPSQLNCINLNTQNNVILTALDDTALNINNIFDLNQSQIQGQNQKVLNIVGNNIILTNSEINANIFIQGNSLVLDSGSKILSTGLGYLAEQGPGAGLMSYGGSYGGLGGGNYESSGFGQPYGNEQIPDDFGSGGGNSIATRKGGNGGGKIEIIISGQLTLAGQIISNGDSGMPMGGWGFPATGAGSGGTIYISANNIIGPGIISVNGGVASTDGGGGGGGRIAVYGNLDNFTGIFEAFRGVNASTSQYNGEDGTIYLDSQNLNPG